MLHIRKKRFYRNIKSNFRLITPIFTLHEIYSGENSPLTRLKDAIKELIINPDEAYAVENYAYQIRMFSSIFKSASTDKAYSIVEEKDESAIPSLVMDYMKECSSILQHY